MSAKSRRSAAGIFIPADCETVGKSACVLGAGRMNQKQNIIDPGAGLRVFAKPGDRIARGDTLAVLYTDSPDTLDEAERLFRLAHTVSDEPPGEAPADFRKGRVNYRKRRTLSMVRSSHFRMSCAMFSAELSAPTFLFMHLDRVHIPAAQPL